MANIINRKFDKPAIPVKDQIALLQKRGLVIQNSGLAERTLTYIG